MQYCDAIFVIKTSNKYTTEIPKTAHNYKREKQIGKGYYKLKNISSLFWFPKENTFCDFCDTLKQNVLVLKSKVYLLQCRNICFGLKKYLKYCVTILHQKY